MKNLKQNSPDCLEISSGAGLPAFGAVLLLGGLLMVAGAFMCPEATQTARLLGGLIGGVLVLLGSGLALGRSFKAVDRQQDTLLVSYGLGVRSLGLYFPIWNDPKPLGSFSHVGVHREIRSNGKSLYTVFPVRLEGNGEPVVMETSKSYQHARRMSKGLAGFLGWELHDHTGDKTVVREASRLDESLAQRLVRKGEPVEIPARPMEMLSEVNRGPDLLEVRIPAKGMLLTHWLWLGLVIAGSVFFAWVRLWWFLLPMGLAVLVIQSRAWRRAMLRVDGKGLWVKKSVLFPGRIIKLGASEIEDLFVRDRPFSSWEQLPEKYTWSRHLLAPKRPCLEIRSDRLTLEVPGAVSLQEMEYIAALLKKTLTLI
jgi:hypothetical protein